MKNLMGIAAMVASLHQSGIAQEIVIDSARGNGSMSFWGADVGTTATVEWAASLGEAGRTNWYSLTNLVVTNYQMTTDIPMFFRVRGTPYTNYLNGLLAFWPFNGNANDESGNGYNGTVQGPQLTADRFGHQNAAYSFINVTNRIDFGTNLTVGTPNTPFTVTFWMYPTASGRVLGDYWSTGTSADDIFAFQCVVMNTTGFLSLESRNYPAHPTDYTQYQSTNDFRNRWSFIAYAMDGTNSCRAYVDGRLVATLPYDASLDYHGDPHWGAGEAPYKPDSFPPLSVIGTIDDIRLYNRVLTIAEIQTLFALPW